MALTNPTKLVNVQELDYFKRKCDVEYGRDVATLEECQQAAAEITFTAPAQS